ncbi:hypothetical protein KM043_018787 [Ampulex compressa]|nr:hypothetical protein KM043_018787 [Ampulex compressa]
MWLVTGQATPLAVAEEWCAWSSSSGMVRAELARSSGASRRRGKDEDRANRALMSLVRGRTVALDWKGTELIESSDARCAGARRWMRLKP